MCSLVAYSLHKSLLDRLVRSSAVQRPSNTRTRLAIDISTTHGLLWREKERLSVTEREREIDGGGVGWSGGGFSWKVFTLFTKVKWAPLAE